jgi:predicted glycosyltransferase involved in capsule biosynthesis
VDLPEKVKSMFDYVEQPKIKVKGVSVIVPVRGRNPSLLICLDYVLKQNIEPLEVIVVEENTTKKVELERHEGKVKYIFVEGGQYFNKARCINTGAMSAAYNIINMNDVDMIMPIHYLSTYCKRLNVCDMCFISKDIYYLDKVPDSIGDFNWNGAKWTDGRKWDYAGGNFSVKKNRFIDIGGMDEQFEGYGGEDGDFYVRSQKLLKFDRVRSLDVPLLHMPHLVNLDNKDKNDKIFKSINKFDRNRIELLKQNLKKY